MPVETYRQNVAEEFKNLPSVYQVELTSACDLQCPMCLRTTEMQRQPKLFPFNLLVEMHRRGDFDGSYYVELQMAGEPTMHPELQKIIRYLQEDVEVKVGLSTHGLNMKKKLAVEFSQHQVTVAQILHELDALTISVDSLDPDVYHKMRFPAHIENLIHNLDYFFAVIETCDTRPFIELQLIETDLVDGAGDIQALTELMRSKGWDDYATIRTTQDCFYEMDGRKPVGSMPRNSDLCINPWTSVSVTADGDVVSCCFIFEPDKNSVNYYGNLKEHSLAEIWVSDRVKDMRRSHKQDKLEGQCKACYLKSPELIHMNIMSRTIRST